MKGLINMQSLSYDLKQPLDKVQRSWIRKPATLILWLPLVFVSVIVAIPVIAFEVSFDWFKSCWNFKI